eukprot:352087-Pyramimonas_sp.AAC.1
MCRMIRLVLLDLDHGVAEHVLGGCLHLQSQLVLAILQRSDILGGELKLVANLEDTVDVNETGGVRPPRNDVGERNL